MIHALVIAAALATPAPSPAPSPVASQAPYTFVIQDTKGKPVLFVPRCNKTQIKSDLSNVGDLIKQCGLYFPGSIEVEVTENKKENYYELGRARILVNGLK